MRRAISAAFALLHTLPRHGFSWLILFFPSSVAPSLSAAYYATVSSSAAPATLAIPPLAVVAGLAALASVLA